MTRDEYLEEAVRLAKQGNPEARWSLQEEIADAYHARPAGKLHIDPISGDSVFVPNEEPLNLHPMLQEWLAWLVDEVMEGRMTPKKASFLTRPPKGMGRKLFNRSGDYVPSTEDRDLQIAARVRWHMRRDAITLEQAQFRVTEESIASFELVKRRSETKELRIYAEAWLNWYEERDRQSSPLWDPHVFPHILA